VKSHDNWLLEGSDYAGPDIWECRRKGCGNWHCEEDEALCLRCRKIYRQAGRNTARHELVRLERLRRYTIKIAQEEAA
jgi:hypothetical protein